MELLRMFGSVVVITMLVVGSWWVRRLLRAQRRSRPAHLFERPAPRDPGLGGSSEDKAEYLFALAQMLTGRDADRTDWPEVAQTLSVICDLEIEVNNGGFSQYFYNSSGARALLAEPALRAMGAHGMADIAGAAVAALGSGFPWDDESDRQAAIAYLTDDIEERLDALDQRFFAYPDPVSELLYAYVDRHRGQLAPLVSSSATA